MWRVWIPVASPRTGFDAIGADLCSTASAPGTAVPARPAPTPESHHAGHLGDCLHCAASCGAFGIQIDLAGPPCVVGLLVESPVPDFRAVCVSPRPYSIWFATHPRGPPSFA